MIRWYFLIFSLFSVCLLSACTTSTHKPQPVSAGKIFEGDLLNVTAPNSNEWHLLESSFRGIAFARFGNEPGESFIAQVTIFFNPPQTDSPEKFEALIVKGAQSDLETERFSTSAYTHEYSDSRGYPCVLLHNISEDRRADTGKGGIKTLILQNEHLYCRHPVRKDLGFAITYSHRGNSLYHDLKKEAQEFIDGVQVPSRFTTQ